MGRGTFCGFFDIITGMENEQLTAENDTRNLIDEFKGLSNEDVKSKLDQSRSGLEVAIENVEHDFNVGTIVRSANNFNVSAVHIIGRHKYNRRGAMCTDKYLTVKYWASAEEFLVDQRGRGRVVVAIENNTPRALPLGSAILSENSTLVFGSEGNGITAELLDAADEVRFIESFGSTRSVNVGVAAGIAMYGWTRQNIIHKK
jgi:tRNA G18 (ribose-2'-O)-methylase SpoU